MNSISFESKSGGGVSDGALGLGELFDSFKLPYYGDLENSKASVLGKFSIRSSIRTSAINNRFRGMIRSHLGSVNQGEMAHCNGLITSNSYSLMKDYLNLENNNEIVKMLTQRHDGISKGICLSDHIYIYDSKARRLRQMILLTKKRIYLIGDKMDHLITYEFSDLEEVTISIKDFNLFIFKFTNQPILLLDSYRRIDIILYIVQMIKLLDMKMFQVVSLRSFKLKKRKNNPIDLDKVRQASMMLPIYGETFSHAKKTGFMKLERKGGIFSSTKFKEYYFILSNLGLIYFSSFGVKID